MNDLNSLSMELSDFLLPWIGVLISLVVAIWFKDFATGLAKGLKFKMDPAFNEGDEVLLDGELAMIVKIGARQTVFGVYSERGYTWRYVPNERIPVLKLEKVIKKDLHVDTDEEKAEYIRPFINAGEDRRPTLTWPRQIPLDGDPSEVVEEVRKNSEFHKDSEIPKLFINADPGSILVGEQREFARTWKNQTEVTVSGNHFVQEDSSEEIGFALRNFVKAL